MVSAKVVATILGAVCYAGDAAVAHRGKSLRKEDPPDITKVVLPKIPQPDFLGPDGLPELPPVSVGTLMNFAASSTLTAVNGEAAKLQKEMQQVQTDNQARIKKDKTGYDNQLKTQERENLHVQAENAKLAKAIYLLEGKNKVLLAHAQALQKDNLVRRTEIQAVGKLLGTTVNFIDEALISTDDSNAPELKVLSEKPTVPAAVAKEAKAAKAETADDADEEDAEPVAKAKKEPKKVSLSSVKTKKSADETKKSDDDDDDSDSDDDAKTPSFLSVATEDDDDNDTDGDDDDEAAPAAHAARAAPKATTALTKAAQPEADAVPLEPQAPAGLLDVLAQGVKDLKQQGAESENQLKALFLSSFNTGKQRHTALLAQNEVLKKTLDTFLDYQKRLQVADKHLQGTKAKLDKAIAEHTVVLSKLSKLALATPEEAEKVMQSLSRKRDNAETETVANTETETVKEVKNSEESKHTKK